MLLIRRPKPLTYRISHSVLSDSLWPMDWSPPASSMRTRNSPSKNTRVGNHSLLQGNTYQLWFNSSNLGISLYSNSPHQVFRHSVHMWTIPDFYTTYNNCNVNWWVLSVSFISQRNSVITKFKQGVLQIRYSHNIF